VYWFYHFTVVLVLTNSCVNPLIYAAKYREFQLGVRRLASCVTRQLTQDSVVRWHQQRQTPGRVYPA